MLSSVHTFLSFHLANRAASEMGGHNLKTNQRLATENIDERLNIIRDVQMYKYSIQYSLFGAIQGFFAVQHYSVFG